MKKDILVINGGNQIKSHALYQIKMENFNLEFSENIYNQIKIIKKFFEEGFNIYILLYSYYQNDIGQINIPYWYTGRLIVSKELGSTVIEFKYDKRLLEKDAYNFVKSLVWTSTVYVSKMNPQRMQDFYYEHSQSLLEEYLENLICGIEIDNDGSYMNFYYDEKKRINGKSINEFIMN